MDMKRIEDTLDSVKVMKGVKYLGFNTDKRPWNTWRKRLLAVEPQLMGMTVHDVTNPERYRNEFEDRSIIILQTSHLYVVKERNVNDVVGEFMKNDDFTISFPDRTYIMM